MTEHIPYRLFANCIPVKGSGRSCICDLQRNRVHPIPNSLFDLLHHTQGQTLAGIKALYHNEHDEVLEEYFTFLEQEELIFYSSYPERFPAMSMHWEQPSVITNALLDIDEHSDYNIASVIRQLDAFDCKYLEIRSFGIRSPEYYQALLEAAEHTTIISVSLLIAFDPDVTEEAWMDLCDRHARLTSLTIHSSPSDKELSSPRFALTVTYSTVQLRDEQCCGVISPSYFSAYRETFTEALQHNTCLNRKIGIDTKGFIRNCPSMPEHFGNVKDTALAEAIAEQAFSKYWNISKDRIGKCRDCEFRYVCTDCRAYLDQPDNLYSAPLKCGYDPYTCHWEDWSTHPMKQQAIGFYNMREGV